MQHSERTRRNRAVLSVKTAILLGLVVLNATSCVHRSPFVSIEETYFQAMGDPSEFVLTVDMKQAAPLYGDALDALPDSVASLLEKADRISIAMDSKLDSADSDPMEAPYPADLSSFDVYGGIEGDFSKFLINTAMMYSKDFTTEYLDDVKYFTNTDGTLSIGLPKNGLIVFSTTDWRTAYDRTWAERQLKIPSLITKKMADAAFGMYVVSPRTMLSLGFDIPITVVLQMSETLILVSYDGQGNPVLDASIRMKSDKLANSLALLIRSQYVAQLRRDGTKFIASELKNLFVTNGEYFVIDSMPLTTAQMTGITTSFNSVIHNFGGVR